MPRPHGNDSYELTDAEKRDLIKRIEQGKPLPDKYRFLLFDDQREVELVWNGKTREVCTAILPFQTLEHIDEPRKESRDASELALDTGGRQLKGWTNKLIWGDKKMHETLCRAAPGNGRNKAGLLCLSEVYAYRRVPSRTGFHETSLNCLVPPRGVTHAPCRRHIPFQGLVTRPRTGQPVTLPVSAKALPRCHLNAVMSSTPPRSRGQPTRFPPPWLLNLSIPVARPWPTPLPANTPSHEPRQIQATRRRSW